MPNNVSYNTILKGFCGENKVHEAFELLGYFDWGANGPDVVSLNTILSAACREGNSLMIQRVLCRMRNERVQLNDVSYVSLIQYFARLGKTSKFSKLIDGMMCQELKFNKITFNLLLHKLCHNGLLGMTWKLFEQLRNKGFLLDMVSYNVLIDAFVRG